MKIYEIQITTGSGVVIAPNKEEVVRLIMNYCGLQIMKVDIRKIGIATKTNTARVVTYVRS